MDDARHCHFNCRDRHLGLGDGMKCPSCNGNSFGPDVYWTEDGDRIRRFFCQVCGESIFEATARFAKVAAELLKERQGKKGKGAIFEVIR